MPKTAQKRERLSVCEQSRAEFFREVHYCPNDFQELIHGAMDGHRRVCGQGIRRVGLTTGLVFEALWQAQRDNAQVVLVAPTFVVQMIHRRMLLKIIRERSRLWSEFLSLQRMEEIRFTGGRAIVSATASTVKGLLGRKLTAVLYDDAEQASPLHCRDIIPKLEKILDKTGGGLFVGALQGNGYWGWIADWRAAAKPYEIIYPPSPMLRRAGPGER